MNGVESLSISDKSAPEQSMSAATQEVVKQALLVGNFEAAVDCCFRTGNLADGLVLASCGGADLWTKTQERYFQSQSTHRPFLSVVNAIIQNEVCDTYYGVMMRLTKHILTFCFSLETWFKSRTRKSGPKLSPSFLRMANQMSFHRCA
jgi:hypothetical protein